jgi:hypothetical protein
MDNLVSVYTTVYTKHLVYSVPSYNSGMPNGQSVISVLPTGADLWLFQSFRLVAKPLVLEGLKSKSRRLWLVHSTQSAWDASYGEH